MRLIDADALIENRFKNDISYNAFCNLVKRQPTIEPEPAVRCKDCINWDSSWSVRIKGSCYCPVIDKITDGSFSCSNGERRTDE